MSDLNEISKHEHDGLGSVKIKPYNVIQTLSMTASELDIYLSRPAIDGDEFNVYINDCNIYRKYYRSNGYWFIISGTTIDSYFGDGSDGNVTISNDTSLDRDMFYSNLTINDGVTLNPNGYRIFVGNITKFIGTGKIARNGNNGGATYIKEGGAALADGSLKGGLAGSDGGSTGDYSGGGGGGYQGTQGLNSSLAVNNVNGKSGGKGGDTTVYMGGIAGTGGTTSTGENTTIEFKDKYALTTLTLDSENEPKPKRVLMVSGITSGELLSTPASSGGGGGGATLGNEAVGGDGGGAGGNAGIVYLASPIIITVNNNNFIEAKGGNGANGGNAIETVPNKNSGGGGGGGGGQGGIAIVIYKSITGTGNISVSGGNGGTGGTGGSGNTSLTKNGVNGESGNNGKYIKIKIS